MDIVIVGDGKVGFTLASQLDHEGHNGATRETLLRAKANLAEAIMIEHKVERVFWSVDGHYRAWRDDRFAR